MYSHRGQRRVLYYIYGGGGERERERERERELRRTPAPKGLFFIFVSSRRWFFFFFFFSFFFLHSVVFLVNRNCRRLPVRCVGSDNRDGGKGKREQVDAWYGTFSLSLLLSPSLSPSFSFSFSRAKRTAHHAYPEPIEQVSMCIDDLQDMRISVYPALLCLLHCNQERYSRWMSCVHASTITCGTASFYRQAPELRRDSIVGTLE